MQTITLSAVVCTHNPRSEYLDATLASIAAQRPLPGGAAHEVVVIDNASRAPVVLGRTEGVVVPRLVREDKLGLTNARLRSVRETSGDIIVFIDDDNILDPDYFSNVVAAFAADPRLGAAGGKSLPCYEVPPPPWFHGLGIDLACRDLGDVPLHARWYEGERKYPACAPIGAGMAIRRAAYAAYVTAVADDFERIALDRRGTSLASAGDNDMVLTLLAAGWTVAYLPALSLTHLIPAVRLTADYLMRYAESTNRTWVEVLDLHGIRPWRPIPAWTVPLRKAKAYLANRAWRSPADRIRWHGASGLIAGQAKLSQRARRLDAICGYTSEKPSG